LRPNLDDLVNWLAVLDSQRPRRSGLRIWMARSGV
jgi:hypothetical protein